MEGIRGSRRVLRTRQAVRAFSASGLEPIAKKLLAAAEPSRAALGELVNFMPPTPISIVALTKAAANAEDNPQMHLLNAKFMLRELAARRAYGLSMMLQAEEEGGEELKALARQPQVLALKQVRALLPRSAP